MTNETLKAAEKHYERLVDLSNAQSILSWDQEVMMPPGGAETRALTMSALTRVVHECATDKTFVREVRSLDRSRDGLKPQERRTVELLARRVKEATAIPADLAAELSAHRSRAVQAWRGARAADDFGAFLPQLEKMVELQRRVARAKAGKGGDAYDALLDDYEPNATTAQLDPLLGELRELTVPLVARVRRSKAKFDMRPLVGRFEPDAQRRLVADVTSAMGIDGSRSRLDVSTHPFCGGVGPVDVRMTGRFDPKDLRGGLFGAIHEAGHGLYEQGLDPKRTRHPLGGAISMAIHESQSRLWENQIARSRPFWKHWLPRLKKLFPKQLAGVSLDAMWRAANAMQPSMIRVEADELTYNLHIVLRYEIERDLISGALRPKDLPARWNDTMHAMLGIRPKNDAEGCMQDIHWPAGYFGYFPTYSVGNLYAAQVMEAARAAIPDLDARVAKGDLVTLREWLRDRIHRHDRVYTADQIVKRVTGKKLSVEPFRAYITSKVDALYPEG
ncbi:MAG: carboxypeptidase M32 [Planctomycetota bacterium]